MICHCYSIEIVSGGKLLADNENKEEITVEAPSAPVVAPQKKAEKATEKALEEERYNVLQIPNKVGKYIGISSICVGATLLVLLAIASSTSQNNFAFLSFSSPLPIVGLWIVVGLISVIVGFLLMGSE
jgi:uncharacterized integral membrane protein